MKICLSESGTNFERSNIIKPSMLIFVCVPVYRSNYIPEIFNYKSIEDCIEKGK